jgi:hypothetical protein
MNHFEKFFIVYEQPSVKFQYKYLIFAENSMENEDSKAIMCSSFEFLNIYENITENCGKIKVSERDLNFDGVPDEINFSFDFHTTHNYGMKSLSMAFFLDARINDQCNMRIPTAVILNKNFNFNNDRKILIAGKLEAEQIQVKNNFFKLI